MTPKTRVFWPFLLIVPLADCTTKDLAVEHLSPAHVPHEVLGSVLRFTLGYNPGMAFGIDPRPLLGAWARPFFVLATLVILIVLLRMFMLAAPTARLFAAAIALAAGGAIGNALDRLRSTRGVVDFIDLGVGSMRLWTFNVADIGITVGTAMLAVFLWREDNTLLEVPAPPSEAAS